MTTTTNSWSHDNLESIAVIQRGKFTHRPRNEPRFYGGTIPFVQTGDVTRSGGQIRAYTQTLNEDGLAISRLFPKGTILITIAANIGYTGILNFDSAAPDSLIAITPNEGVDSEYLNFYLMTQQPVMDQMAPRGTQKNINIEFLKPWPVPLPSFAEQQKIAYVLSVVQRAMEQQERLIQATAELKKAMMQKLFTEGTRGEPQKHTEIGRVPQSWDVVRLDATGDVIYGIQAAVANNLQPVGTRILTNKNLTLEGNFNLEKINYFECKTERHFNTRLQHGDILFNWRSGSKHHVGKTAFFDLEGEWVHSSFILRIRPNDEVNNRFLFHYLNYLRESGYFIKLQTYAINAKFNKSAVSALPTTVPEPDEQDEIAEALDTVKTKVAIAQRKLNALSDLFRTLLHKLMNAELRVHDIDLPGFEGALYDH